MERTLIRDITPGTRAKVRGFVENLRNKRTMAFIVVKDITGKLQLTVEKEKYPEIAAEIDRLSIHSVVTVEGIVVANEYVKMGGIEMLPDAFSIDSIAEAPLMRIRKLTCAWIIAGLICAAKRISSL